MGTITASRIPLVASAPPFEGEELTRRPNERRIFADNSLWSVYELPPCAYALHDASSLIFESIKIVRRVRNYPRNWRALPDAELILLKERT